MNARPPRAAPVAVPAPAAVRAPVLVLDPGGAAWVVRLAVAAWSAQGHPVEVVTRPSGEGAVAARLALLAARPGVLVAESDVIALAPVAAPGGWFLAAARPGAAAIGTALLAIPADSALLAALVAAASPGADLGALLSRLVPVHAAAVPVHPARAVAALSKARRPELLRPGGDLEALVGPGALALRLWPATGRDLADRPDGRPPAGTPLAALAARFGLDATADPAVPDRAGDTAALLAALGDRIASVADLGGRAPDLAAAAQARFDCDIVAVDIDRTGAFPPQPSPWIAGYRAALAAAGVPEGRLRVVRGPEGLAPVDVVLNLGLFGDTGKVHHLGPLLEACLHADSLMVSDIRKGSGAWPWLRARGSVTALSARSEVTRVLFRPDQPAAPADPGWPALARSLAGPGGFFTEGAGHSFLFVPRGRTLVVTFDNLDIAMSKREDRRPWGYAFIERQGWSMLGVMAGGWTWYREPWVWAEFDRLRDAGFFAGFERVVFYGASMGGYAACAFVPACPGADVVAISPQSTLDRRLVPWETRYRTAWGRDFSGPYGDAAVVSAAARRVTILYDPYEPLDAAHAARFEGGNVLKLRAPLMGHRLGSSLNQMGILSPVILAALDGSLTPAAFYRALRARRSFPRYQRELFERAAARHPRLARRLGAWVLAQGDHRAIREAMRRL